MPEIEISYTWGSNEPTLASLVTEFSRQTGVQIHLRRVDWAAAWVDLFTTATEGQRQPHAPAILCSGDGQRDDAEAGRVNRCQRADCERERQPE